MATFFSDQSRSFYFLVLGLVFGLTMASCQDSGPCEWYTSRFHAGVSSVEFKEINAEGDSTYRVLLQFDQGTLSRELQDLGELRQVEITREDLVQNSIRPGNSYTGSISDVKSGNCKSPIVAFDQKWR